MSLPAVNTPSEPVSSTAPIVASSALSSNATRIASYMASVKAFFLAGLVIAITATPSSREIVTSFVVM